MKKSELKKVIGNSARQMRVALGWTQADVAEKLGVTVEFYARIERGQSSPSIETFRRMAIVFQGGDRLLGLEDKEEALQHLQKVWAKEPDDSPELRRLIRRLRKAELKQVRFLASIFNKLAEYDEYEDEDEDDEDEDEDEDEDSILDLEEEEDGEEDGEEDDQGEEEDESP